MQNGDRNVAIFLYLGQISALIRQSVVLYY